MAKPDGRVEAGQSLKRAISAQRWNDLCDAADIVHGRRGGVRAGGPKYPPMYLTAAVELEAAGDYPHPGVAIELTDFANTDQSAASGWPDSERHVGTTFLKGRPAPFKSVLPDTFAALAPFQVAITVEPMTASSTVVQCAVVGIVMAYVKVHNKSHRYANVYARRSSGDPQYYGLLESGESGLIQICTNGTIFANPGDIVPLPVKL
jgi:hypothetical protein